MNRLKIEPLSHDNATIDVTDRDNTISINFSGMIDMRDPSVNILPYLLRIHDEIVTAQLEHVYANLSKLSFMNSSGIKTFISWIMKLDELPDEKKYKIIIEYNADTTWQQSSIRVINKLFPDFIEIYSE